MPEGHPVKIHMFPPGWDLMGGQWVAVPVGDLSLSGKVTVCLECGSVVVPQFMDVHAKRCGSGEGPATGRMTL